MQYEFPGAAQGPPEGARRGAGGVPAPTFSDKPQIMKEIGKSDKPAYGNPGLESVWGGLG